MTEHAHTELPELVVGRRVHCILYGGKDGTIVAVHGEPKPHTVRSHSVMVAGGNASVDIVWDNATQSKMVPEAIVCGSVQWRVYPDIVSSDTIAELKDLARQAEAIRQREKEDAERQFQADKARLIEENPHLVPGDPAVKNIRRVLKKEFPGVKFSVRSDHNSVRIRWSEGPEPDAVKPLVKRFQSGHFDGMTDCYEYNRKPWNAAFGDVKFVFTEFDGVTR